MLQHIRDASQRFADHIHALSDDLRPSRRACKYMAKSVGCIQHALQLAFGAVNRDAFGDTPKYVTIHQAKSENPSRPTNAQMFSSSSIRDPGRLATMRIW